MDFSSESPWRLLGVSFLQQGAPELVVGGGVKHDEAVPHSRQSVVHHHIQPFVVLPELKKNKPQNGELFLIIVTFFGTKPGIFFLKDAERKHDNSDGMTVQFEDSAATEDDGNFSKN